MVRNSRRRFLKGVGAAAGVGLAGCSGGGDGGDGGGDGGDGGDGGSDGGGDGGDGGSTTQGPSLTPITVMQPEGTLYYPFLEGAVQAGVFEEVGLDVETQYRPFPAQAQSVTSGEVDTSMVPFLPSLSNYVVGEDLVLFGFDGNLQLINSLYALADSGYETIHDMVGGRIGVWTFGSSTVQSFQTLLAEREGLQLREDFETTTAAPPALLGLLQDGEVDGIVNVSGLSITMESQPDTYKDILGLNQMWLDETGHTLPLTGWFAYADWYEQNTDVAAALVEGSRAAVTHWRENTQSILDEFGGPANIDNQAKIDVCIEWSGNEEIWQGEQTQAYLDATWQFVELMNNQGFIDEVPAMDGVYRNPEA